LYIVLFILFIYKYTCGRDKLKRKKNQNELLTSFEILTIIDWMIKLKVSYSNSFTQNHLKCKTSCTSYLISSTDVVRNNVKVIDSNGTLFLFKFQVKLNLYYRLLHQYIYTELKILENTQSRRRNHRQIIYVCYG